MRSQNRRVLVSTLPLWGGGVRAITELTLGWLREAGYEPVVAYHQPYSIDPSLSVPAFAFPWKGVKARRFVREDGIEVHEMGAWLPELEFMHYYPTAHWQRLIGTCDHHVAVSGNCFAALPLARSGRPYLGWIATAWRDDRLDRERAFKPLRRLWDRVLVRPLASRLERSILRAQRGTLLALSNYTARRLDAVAGGAVVSGTLPSAVETERFRPDPARVVPGRIAFCGRLGDPRKNVGLFLQTLALLRQRGHAASGVLLGGTLAERDALALRQLGLADSVTIAGHVDRDALPAFLQAVDVFVVPSTQEGLCIAALEAMAAGCPVVSTRCGGPEEFVVAGRTGYLVDSEPVAMAEAIERIVERRGLRAELSAGARQLVLEKYGGGATHEVFRRWFGVAFQSRGEHQSA